MTQLFLDCDGVLADFDTHFYNLTEWNPHAFEGRYGSKVFWSKVKGQENFYGNLPLMDDAMELYNAVAHLRPIILTGCPMGGWAEPQKMAWGRQHFQGTPMITCMSRDKAEYCRPGDILIDDRPGYRKAWEEVGGIWITHSSAAMSLKLLKKALP